MSRSQLMGGALLGVILAAIVAAPLLSPNDPLHQHADMANAPPMLPRIFDGQSIRAPFIYPLRLTNRLENTFAVDRAHPVPLRYLAGGRLISAPDTVWLPLGADRLGRDVFARVLDGGRRSIGVAVVAVMLTLLIGVTAGAVGGYAGGWADAVIIAIADFVIVLPALYAILTLRAAMPLEIDPPVVFCTMVVVIALASWPTPARVVRAVIAIEGRKAYAESAYAAGAGPLRILLRHLLPAAARQILLQGLLLFPAFVFAEITLSFLGFGFAAPLASWGSMLRDASGIAAMTEAPWLLAPAGAIVATVVAVHLLAGDEDAFVP